MQSKISKIIILTLLTAVTGGASALIKMQVDTTNIADGDYAFNYYFNSKAHAQSNFDDSMSNQLAGIIKIMIGVDLGPNSQLHTDLAKYGQDTFLEDSTFELTIPTTTGIRDCKMTADQLNAANSANETITFPNTTYCPQ